MQLPYSEQAEMSVLGSVLINEQCLGLVSLKLKPDDFYLNVNRAILETMLKLHTENKTVDVVTLSTAIDISTVGGAEYLAKMALSVPTTENLRYYIDIILEKSRRRTAILALRNAEMALMTDDDMDVARANLDAATSAIGTAIDGRPPSVHIKPLMVEQLGKIEQRKDGKVPVGVPTGLNTVNHWMLGGFAPSDVVVIAARPAMGKTAFAVQLGLGMSIHHKVLFKSLEMSQDQIAQRILSQESLVSMEHIKTGHVTDAEWPLMARGVSKVCKYDFHIGDRPLTSVSDIRFECKQLHPDVLIIDYLQLLDGGGKKSGNREQEIAAIMRELKILAKDMDIPVIVLAQLSRATTQRADKRPQLTDLRESGAIEQDADVVMFLHREDYYNPETEKKNITECIVAKFRNGATGTFELYWMPEYTLFRDIRPDGWKG